VRGERGREYNIGSIREGDANVPIPIYLRNELWTEVIRGDGRRDRSYTSLRRVKDELELSLVGMRGSALGRGSSSSLAISALVSTYDCMESK